MSKKLLVAAAALVVTTLLSGCWALRESGWTVDKVEPGKATTLRVGLAPSGADDLGRFFMALLLKSSGDTRFGPAKFDSTGVLTRPKRMMRDTALLERVDSEGTCDEFVPSLSGGFLFRTRGNVSSDTRKFIEASLRAKVSRQAKGGGAGGFVITGEWRDDGDLVPEDTAGSDDEYDCTGASTTLFNIKGPPVATRVDLERFGR